MRVISPRLTQRRLSISAVAALVLLVAGVWFGSWYFRFEQRFARSKSALEKYAARVMESDPQKPLPPPPRRLGSFKAGHAERLPHGFLFFCDYGHPLDANGLAYSTEPLPTQAPDRDVFEHIQGNWYTVWRN
jgi:hypothetical protein